MQFELSTTIGGRARLEGPELERIALNGFAAIDVSLSSGGVDSGDQPRLLTFRESAAAAGLAIGGLSAAWPLGSVALDCADALGAKRITLIADACRAHAPTVVAPADAATIGRALDSLALEATARGLTLAIEFPRTFTPQTIVDLVDSVDDLIDSVDGGPVGVCLDAGHAHLAGGAPEAIELLSGYVTVVHLHDNQGREDSHRAPYSGSVDWPLTLMALWKTGFAGAAILEMTPDPDMVASLARAVGARTRLQAILDDLAQPMVFPE